ncbi:MAG: hemolysin family protein, partial [Armatimonadota bacterium]|nr:hemolysin family protein [Armatimonadota bacterium]
AKTVLNNLNRLDTFLSATQLGVTIATLGLSLVGEPVMHKLLDSLFLHLNLHLSHGTLNTLALVIGFTLITFLEVIFGELLPKWAVIEHAEKFAFLIAYPMNFFVRLFYPIVWFLERSASAVARVVGLHPDKAGEHEQAHSSGEVIDILTASHEQGEFRASEVEIAKRLFEFAHTQANRIMVPRVDMVYLSTDWNVARNVEIAVENGFTRYPFCEGDRDHVIGMIHIKDLLAISADPNANIRSIMRPILAVPENKAIDELMKQLQNSRTHQAIVVDEYGGTAGLVTLEDIIEELVGEIEDEDKRQAPPLQRLDERGEKFSIAGTVHLDEVVETLGVPIPNPEDFDTIGSYALHQLQMPPRAGATAQLDGFDVAVTDAIGRRIRRLQFTRHAPPADLSGVTADGH